MLPSNAKIKDSRRDYLIIDFFLQTEPTTAVRLAVFFDEDRDERICDVLTVLYYREREVFEHVIAAEESKGHLTLFLSGAGDYRVKDQDHLESDIKQAVDIALHDDCWSLDIKYVPTVGHKLDRRAKALDPRFNSIIPTRFDLGLVRS